MLLVKLYWTLEVHLKKTAVPEDKYEELHTRLGNHSRFTVMVEGKATIKSKEVWKGCVSKDTITSFLSSFGDVEGILYTLHNFDNVKYHGNPVSG